jgi:tRNA threonylcarbamoyladenosine biosynthesis protein TsaE
MYFTPFSGMGKPYSFTLDTIRDAARWFLAQKGDHRVIALQGDMGAGKTTFVRACCDELGVADAVGSPTYSLVNEYWSPVAGTIYHIDLYRIAEEEEARLAGIEDILFSGALCFVEWPSVAPGIFPGSVLEARLSVTSPGGRRLEILSP